MRKSIEYKTWESSNYLEKLLGGNTIDNYSKLFLNKYSQIRDYLFNLF